MRPLRNIRIFFSILIVSALMVSLMAIPSIVTYTALQSNEQDAIEFDAHTVERMSSFSTFKDNFNRALINIFEYTQTGDETVAIRAETRIAALRTELEHFASLSASSEAEIGLANDLRRAYEYQIQSIHEFRSHYEEGASKEILYADLLGIRTARIQAEQTIHVEIDAQIREQRRMAVERIKEVERLFRIFFVVAFAIALLLSAVLALIIARLVSISVKQAKAFTERIAGGDLETVIPVSDKNEFGQLMTALESMRQSLKVMVDAKDDFIALISHQFRTPLTVLRGNVQIFELDKSGLTEAQKRSLDHVKTVTLGLVKLVDDILSVIKMNAKGLDPIETAPVDVSAVVGSVVEIVAAEALEKKVTVKHTIPNTPLPHPPLHERSLEQILVNLIENAVKYTGADVNSKPKREVEIRYRTTPDALEVAIADTGIGIPEQDQRRVFTKFFRASNVVIRMENGNGLGLLLVKHIVDRLGGTIRFESTENVGTTFYLTFPLKRSTLNPNSDHTSS